MEHIRLAFVCLQDFENYAAKTLNRNSLTYYKSGADQEQTVHENKEAFKWWRFHPRFLVDVSAISLKTTIQGCAIDFPVCIAPTAMQKMAHPQGEIANAKAAARMGTCFTLSTIATCNIEEVAAEAPVTGLRWFQLYIFKDREITVDLVRRAEMAGYKALVLTVDTPTFGNRLADVANKFTLPPHLRMANFDKISDQATNMMNENQNRSALAAYSDRLFDDSLTWQDVAWLKSITSLPVIAKGILTGDDAKQALSVGIDGIVVSNHGGRQLDGVSSTIMALPDVCKAVNKRCEVYLDGGVRCGTDVLKALALGARCVFIGRPALWGLAVQGESGVVRVLEILKTELELAMKLSGVTDVNSVSRDLVYLQAKL